MDSSENPSDEETLEDWSQDQLRKRSQELQLIDEYGKCISPNLETNRRSIKISNAATTTTTTTTTTIIGSRMGDEINANDNDDGSKSASTTSDSQVENKGTLETAVDEQSIATKLLN